MENREGQRSNGDKSKSKKVFGDKSKKSGRDNYVVVQIEKILLI